jgi:hypothetical protein
VADWQQQSVASELELVSKLLVELDRRFAMLHKRRQEVFDREWNKKFDQDSLQHVSRKLSAIEPEKYAALHTEMDRLCDFYLAASDAEREALRLHLGMRPDALREMLNHIGWATEHVHSAADHIWVLRGLAAVSLEDHRIDYRDVYLALGDLYLAAVRAGIDASLCFQDVAALSNPNPGKMPGGGSLRDFLGKFESSAFFAESVTPKLPV